MKKTCYVCKSNDLKFLFRQSAYAFLRYCSSAHTSIDPVPDQSTLDQDYEMKSHNDFNYDVSNYKDKEFVEAHFSAHIIDKLNLQDKNIAILDIGCYCGLLLDQFKKNGFSNLYGLEMLDRAYSVTKSKHTNVYNMNIENFEKVFKKNKYFDLVICVGLIEHLREPLILKRLVNKILKKDGFLVIQTPFCDPFFSKLLGRLWMPYSAPEHIHYFTKKSINLFFGDSYESFYLSRHFKKLKISYVLDMFKTFGKAFLPFINLLKFILPKMIKDKYFYFYAGEKIWIGKKL